MFSAARGKGRGRSRNEDDEDGAGGRPSGPSTLFDFLESKMGVLSINSGGPFLRLIPHLCFPYLIFLWFVFSEPKSQPSQRPHENKGNVFNANYHSKDTSQAKFSHNDHRQQRTDRPPRFHKDIDFPKPGQEPASNCITSLMAVHTQQWKGQEKWPRVQNDRRETRDEQIDPSVLTTSLTHSKESQQQIEFSGSYHQRSRNGNGGGNISGPSYRRGPKDNTPTSKLSNSAGSEADGKGTYRRVDRNEDANNGRRKGKADRPNSDYFDRQKDGGPSNFNQRGGSSGTSQDVGLLQDPRITTGDPTHFQNGEVEHKRTGPIKPTNFCSPYREQQPKKNNPSNAGYKKRSGQGKGPGPRGPERNVFEYTWKPGDQCLALYWEDNKVHCLGTFPRSPITVFFLVINIKFYL